MTNARVVAEPWLNLRDKPALTGSVLTHLMTGAQVEVLERSGAWARVRAKLPSEGWVNANYLDIAAQPAPQRPPIRIGFNCVVNHRVFDRAWELGFRAALVCDDFTHATELSERPELPTILARRVEYNAHDPVTGVQQLEGMGARRVIYTSHNEQDAIGGDIRARFAEDMAMANEARARGTRFAGGGWSMGNPDFTNPQVCRDIAETYAPAFNAGLMDLHIHTYADNNTEVETGNGHHWYSTRAGFLFTDCGFSLNAKGRLHLSETGVDRQNLGGMVQYGYTPEQVVNWTRRYIKLLTSPWTSLISQRTIPHIPVSTLLFFQLGDQVRWRGYEMSAYLEAMAAAGLALPQ